MFTLKVACEKHDFECHARYLMRKADGHRVPLCLVVVGGSTGALPYLKRAVADKIPVLVLKVRALQIL